MFDILWNIKYIYSLACYDRHFSRTPGIDCVHEDTWRGCCDTRTRRVAFKCRMHRERDIQPHYQDVCKLEFSIYLRDIAGLIYIAIFYWHIDRLYIYIYRINCTIHSVFVIERLSKVCEMSYHNHSLSKKFLFSLEIHIHIYLLWKSRYYKIFQTDIKRKKIKLDKLTLICSLDNRNGN